MIEWVLDGDRVIVRKAGEFSSSDIHHAVFEERPGFRTDEELKQGIARHLRNKHARS